VTDDKDDLTNGDLARIFHEIGDMLELNGELVSRPSPTTVPPMPQSGRSTSPRPTGRFSAAIGRRKAISDKM
jgi:hypothetical protein